MSALLITPVTAALKTDLVTTGSFLDTYTTATMDDATDYPSLVSLLDTLTRSVFTAAATGPMYVDITHAARFNMGPDTALVDVLAASVTYLRVTAIAALAGTLSPSTHALCDQIWETIQTLFSTIMDAIARLSSIDLDAVHGNGAGQLIDAATLLAVAAHS